MSELDRKTKTTIFAIIDLSIMLVLGFLFVALSHERDVSWAEAVSETMGYALLLYLFILFLPLPYDRLVSASAFPDRISGKLANLVLYTRMGCLRFFFFFFFAALITVLILFLPLIAPLFLLMVLWDTLRKRMRGVREPILGIVLLVLLVCVVGLGLLAPIKALAVALYFLTGRPVDGWLADLATGADWLPYDIAIGVAGIVSIAAWLSYDAFWRLRQVRQVENLPTSKVRSLSAGLVELSGIVRPLDASGTDNPAAIEISRDNFIAYLHARHTVNLFRLDDGTGSVLVDARGCRARAGWLSGLLSVIGMRELVLTWRIERNLADDSERRSLNYGDRIYVIGNAEVNPNAPPDAVGPDRLVIRPSDASTWSETFWQNLFGIAKGPRGKDIQNVFFLSDSTELEARRHIMNGFLTVLLFSFLWFAASAGLLWSTALPERAAHPHASSGHAASQLRP